MTFVGEGIRIRRVLPMWNSKAAVMRAMRACMRDFEYAERTNEIESEPVRVVSAPSSGDLETTRAFASYVQSLPTTAAAAAERSAAQ